MTEDQLVYFRRWRATHRESVLASQRKCDAKRRGTTGRKLNQDKQSRQYRDFIQTTKLDSGCVKCGYRDDPANLHFHHPRGDKSFTVGEIRKGMKLLRQEIAKCVVLCFSCHYKVHPMSKGMRRLRLAV